MNQWRCFSLKTGTLKAGAPYLEFLPDELTGWVIRKDRDNDTVQERGGQLVNSLLGEER